jgi:Zinc-binding dehydrogenase
MKLKEIIQRAGELAKPYRISDGENFRLKNIDPGDTGALTSDDKPRAKEALTIGIDALAQLQDMLYAQDRWAGAVGLFAVQLAHLHGAFVIATASERKTEFVKQLGADEAIDYKTSRFEDQVGSVDTQYCQT